ncbi:MAG: methylated-DNA--[protein]-cysteine S-methyltransferase [Rubrivivax sp.]|nr:MAG: methylated-DNA--[protein]-cysteine S-methyltransferase [Rubrivivax sp.]
MYTAQLSIESPLGRILLARTTKGLAGVWFEQGQKDTPGALQAPFKPDDDLLLRAGAQLSRYWAGGSTDFDLPLDLIGTPFQVAVWQLLLTIPHGHTRSYGDLAASLGKPQASRAVGAAVGRNPISIIVPCHRIVGRDDSLTGFAGGMERKVALLAQEGHVVQGSRLRRPTGLTTQATLL